MNKSYIFKARQDAGKTQSEVADHLGMKLQTYASKEQRTDFTTVELKRIGDFIGVNLIEMELSLVEEDETIYGKAGAQYRKMLSAFSEVSTLQKAQIIIQAEIIAAIKNKSLAAAINEIKKLIKNKTGKDIDL